MAEKQEKDDERVGIFLKSLWHGKSLIEIENEEELDHDDDCICDEVPCVDAESRKMEGLRLKVRLLRSFSDCLILRRWLSIGFLRMGMSKGRDDFLICFGK